MKARGIVGWALWVGIVVLGQGWDGRAEEGWAEALFTEHGHDFGPVPRGAKVRHGFVLTNRYAETISILDVRASCGCTSGRASASVVPPGGSAVIEAEMDTRNFVGPKATTLTVTMVTANGRHGEARLAVSSNILSDIVLNPGSIDFGAVARGQTARQVLTIDRYGAPAWTIERMIATSHLSQYIDASLVETLRTPQAVGYQLTVSLKPDAPAGPIREEIRIVTNDRESPVVPVLVTAMVRGALTASPSLLAMGRVSSAQGVQGRFLIRGTKPFAIKSIEGEGDGFQVASTDPSRKALHIVTVSYKPELGTTRGDLRRTFRVVTDLPGEPALELNATLHVDP